ncbi:LPXTG cell wall anchor domain-containing protein [Lactiplantibacillus mudanjiangensis]|uniref:Cell surface protein [Lactobacillus plantarum] n=1 Tax=Lactiplantibacillus mudanjiangensis TaxID=1296538 RepID=A0A660DVR2_9LACO|nr:LPXTG cell wall anchor domain-containing protein [Lactiplantibacillus mudanjiangensis]VDG23804.1 cell surface protein [Lactobacillus plantarum] [Lactiplantibacillus mudanjiangensis]VDG27433.1 cell surface protein [Lactobacillus plantarum] [Lactiplantibacillus mudanjiangensis]
MKRLLISGLLFLMMLFGVSRPTLAATTDQTTTSVGFYAGTSSASASDTIDPSIPNGSTPYAQTPRKKTNKSGTSNHAGDMIQTATLKKALAHGRLPQTGEMLPMYWVILGGLSLLALLLMLLVLRQARSLAERNE